MRCSACGAANPAGAKFCEGCGSALTALEEALATVERAAESLPDPALCVTLLASPQVSALRTMSPDPASRATS